VTTRTEQAGGCLPTWRRFLVRRRREEDDEGVLLEQWSGWIDEQWAELIYLYQQREIVHETIAGLERNGENHVFANALFQMYVRYQSIGVRRLIDHGQDTHSLLRLMVEARQRPGVLGREGFVQAHVDRLPDPVRAADLANQHYDDLWGAGSPEPSRAAIKADIKLLRKRTDAVRRFTNWTQAHMVDKTPDPISLADLEKAVDDLVELFQKWAMAVTRTHREVRQLGAPDWREPLRLPLFDDRPLPAWPPENPTPDKPQ
jgi:hypothetical protein